MNARVGFALVLVLAFGALGVSWKLLRSTEPQPLAESFNLSQCLSDRGVPSVLSEREANSEVVRGAVTACLGPHVEAVASRSGPDSAWDALAQFLDENPGAVADCHEIAHYLAHGAASFLPASELVVFSRPLCEYGYLDGLAMVVNEENPNEPVESVVRRIDQACRTYPPQGPDAAGVADNCFHGIGHVLWDRLRPNALEVRAHCLALEDFVSAQDVPPSAQCIGGAAMDVSAATVDTPELVVGVEFPGQFCRDLPRQAQRECLAYSISSDLRLRNGSARAYLRWCTDPTSGITATEGCFSALAGQAGFFRTLPDFLTPCVEFAGVGSVNATVCAASAVGGLLATSSLTHEQAVDTICAQVPLACLPARALQPASG